MCANASTSSCELTGLLKCAFMPASRESLRSSAKALALTAIIGVVAASSRSSARIRRVASRPSMPGIMMSINTTSYSCGALAVNTLDGRLTILGMRHDGTGTAERKLRDLGIQIVILYE